MIAQAIQTDGTLSTDVIRQTLHDGLENRFTNQRVLVLIPDHTRTIPLPFLFRQLVEILHDVRQLDFMVALGTHPALSEASLNQLAIKMQIHHQVLLAYLYRLNLFHLFLK